MLSPSHGVEMQYHHGTLVCDGQSLNGFSYSCGDPVMIYDDGQNGIGNHDVHVLNIRDGQFIIVPLRAVCWVPVYSEERHGRTFLFTLYGQRFNLPPESDGSQDCTGSRAIQVSFEPMGRLDYSHTVLTEERLSKCAHRLEDLERQAYFALAWSLASACPLQIDVDSASERSSSVGLTLPSMTSPATPSSAVDMDTFGLILRRDSAVDLSDPSPGVDGQELYTSVENNPVHDDSSGMFSPLGSFDSCFSFKNEARPQPSASQSQSPAGADCRAMSPWLESYEPYLDPGLVGANDMPVLQINCMYLPPANPGTARPSADQTQASLNEDNSLDWAASVDIAVPAPGGHGWGPVQFSQGAGTTQESHCSPPVPMQSLVVEGPPQMQPLTMTNFPMPTADSAQCNKAQSLSAGPPAPFFYRVQQSTERTVGLTASPDSSTGRTTSQRQKRRRTSDRAPPKARRARRSRQKSPDPPPQYRPFRPELIADFFSRQTQWHMEPLEARCREQLDSSSSVPPGEAVPSEILSGALDLIRTAHTKVVKVLGTLRPVTQEPFELREARIRQDADKIIAVIQNIRNAALEGGELAEQDVRSLKQRTEAFVSYVEWVRELDKTGQEAEAKQSSTKEDKTPPGSDTMAAASSAGGPVEGSTPDNTAAAVDPTGFPSTTAAAAVPEPAGPPHSHPSAYWPMNSPAPGAMEYETPGFWPLPPAPDSQAAAYPPPQPTGPIPHGAPLSAGPQPSLYQPDYPAEFGGQSPGHGPSFMIPSVSAFGPVPTTAAGPASNTLHIGAAASPMAHEACVSPASTTFHPASIASPLSAVSPMSLPTLVVPPAGRRSSRAEPRLNQS